MSRVEPIKFRCDRCGQLLGVSPSRAGRPVKCPKCGTGLTVPVPKAPLSSPQSATPGGEITSVPRAGLTEAAGSETKSAGFFDAIELDPEDLKTLFPFDSEESPALSVGAEGGGIESVATSEPSSAASEERDERHAQEARGTEEAIEEAEGQGLDVISVILAERPEKSEKVGDREPSEASLVRYRASRDVVMPRIAVVLWSVVVLIAVFLAFVAGLLAGHFLWVGPV